MAISGNSCDRRRRQSIRKADVGDPDRNPELQSVRLDVLGGEDWTRVRTTHVPNLKAILFTSCDDLKKEEVNVLIQFYNIIPKNVLCFLNFKYTKSEKNYKSQKTVIKEENRFIINKLKLIDFLV